MMRTQRETEDEYERGLTAGRVRRLGAVAGLGGAACAVAALLIEALGSGKPLGEALPLAVVAAAWWAIACVAFDYLAHLCESAYQIWKGTAYLVFVPACVAIDACIHTPGLIPVLLVFYPVGTAILLQAALGIREWAHGRNGDEELARGLGERRAGSARPRPMTR